MGDICTLLTVQRPFPFLFPLRQLSFVGLNQFLTSLYYPLQRVVGFIAYFVVFVGNDFNTLHGFSYLIQMCPSFFFLVSIMIHIMFRLQK